MAKKTTTPMSNPFIEIVQKVHDHGLRGSPERVVEMIHEIDINFYSFAITEDNKAMVLVIARDDYYDES